MKVQKRIYIREILTVGEFLVATAILNENIPVKNYAAIIRSKIQINIYDAGVRLAIKKFMKAEYISIENDIFRVTCQGIEAIAESKKVFKALGRM